MVRSLHIIRTVRNKISPAEALTIGALMRAARTRTNQSIQEFGAIAGVHHSQVSRCERGQFRTANKNVQRMCALLGVSHEKLLSLGPADHTLKERFDILLKKVPGSAEAFSRLFDVLEASSLKRSAGKKQREG